VKPETAENLKKLAVELDLVPESVAEEALHEAGDGAAGLAAFGQVLVRRELLTSYQLERLLKGERTGYFYGHAKILYQIGAGAFARVYRAIHRETGGMLAVKVLRNRFSADASKQAAFLREGEMGRTLRHPHIVAVEDVGHEGGITYITLEFVEGQTLRQLVKIRGALDLQRSLELIHQLLSGLEFAHRRGVTHRDLKASNVVVSATGVAKLADFGLAGVDEPGGRGHSQGHQLRTLDYAALEKLAGVKDDDVRSDIYFLGTVAYLALCGQSALEESRDRAVRSEPRRFTQVVPLGSRAPHLPRDVVDFVGRLMHVDPQQRWQTAAEARRALEPIMAKHAAGGGDGTGTTTAPKAVGVAPAATRGSLMLVESGEQAQQKLRDFFTKLGYRVLLTENPQRALARFSSTPLPANCLVISTLTLGDCALEAFNQLSADPFLAPVPAILLVNSKQQAILEQARSDALRQVASMPIGGAEMLKLIESITTLPG
jgi:serine/threonine-protein kinase